MELNKIGKTDIFEIENFLSTCQFFFVVKDQILMTFLMLDWEQVLIPHSSKS